MWSGVEATYVPDAMGSLRPRATAGPQSPRFGCQADAVPRRHATDDPPQPQPAGGLQPPGSPKAAELLAEADPLDDVSGAMAAPSYDASTQKRLHYDAHRTRRKRGR